MTHMIRKGLLLTTGLMLLAVGPAVAQADPDPRVEALERQIEALRADVKTLKAEKAAPNPAEATRFSPVPQWTSADKAFSFKLRGRVEVDTAFFNVRRGNRDFDNGTELRRARLGVDGKLFTDWAYRLEADVAAGSRDDSGGSELDVKDAYIQYVGLPNLTITAGQHKTPNGLDQLTSSTNLTFLERASFSEAFLDRRNAGGDFKLGVSARYARDNWSLTTGVFGENAAISGASGADEGYGFHGRATFTPVNTAKTLIHLGVSGFWRDTGGRGTVRFGDRPEVRVDNARLVDTAAFTASSYTFAGAEFIGASGPFFLQAEYGRTAVDRPSGLENASFDGGYVAAGWLLTGERLPYKDGALGRLEPRRNFSLKDGGWGAWQLAARYSRLDLDDEAVLGGRSKDFTLGLNWYANPYVRVLFNWVRFDTDRRGVVLDGDAFATRLAVNW